MTTFGVGFGNFFGGSLIKLSGSDVPSIALSATSSYFSKSLPFRRSARLVWKGISYPMDFWRMLAIMIALHLCLCAEHTRAWDFT